MAEIQALEWIFSSPAVFLMFMVFLTMIGTLVGTKQIRASVLMAVLTLVYSSYSQNEYITGVMYILIVVITLLVANQLYDLIIGRDRGEAI